MKVSYQQYRPGTMALAKEFNLSHDEILKAVVEVLADKGKNKATSDEKVGIIIDTYVAVGGAKHYFVGDESFMDWILDCTPTLEDGIPQVIGELTKYKPSVMHFPTSSKYKTLAFKVSPRGKERDDCSVDIVFSHIGPKGGSHGRAIFQDTKFFEPGNPILIHSRLIAGLGMYVSCFPDMLVPGIPLDLKHPSHHKYEDVTSIGVSPKVRVHTEHGEVTPHFRRGHFRVLRSEHFKNKRHQVVFVRQCFVKGEVATILSPEEDKEYHEVQE